MPLKTSLKQKIAFHQSVDIILKNQLIQHDFEIVVGNTRHESNYPNIIAYNVARIEGYFFKCMYILMELKKRHWEAKRRISPFKINMYYSFRVNC
ncbi:MAG: DUF6873 family GME fold protein [Caldicoprobacterales bacterium]